MVNLKIAAERQRLALSLILDSPKTAHELADAMGLRYSQAKNCVSSLREKGCVRISGKQYHALKDSVPENRYEKAERRKKEVVAMVTEGEKTISELTEALGVTKEACRHLVNHLALSGRVETVLRVVHVTDSSGYETEREATIVYIPKTYPEFNTTPHDSPCTEWPFGGNERVAA